MTQVDPVVLQLRADLANYRAELSNAQRLSDAKLDAIEKRGFAMGQSIQRSFNLATKSALQFAAGMATLQTARELLALADEAKSLDAQLRLATAGFGSFNQAQQDVQRIADVTRSGLSDTAALYGNFARASKEMGASQAEAARATETFSKTLKISGADAAESASATLQFGQALAAGALRGDELNSILEASPRLARLLAESMNQPIGQIKAMGEAGQLTSDKLLRALTEKKFTEGIDAEFEQLPVTFDQAMTKIENAALVTFGAFDRGGEFSTMLANFVSDGADGFRDLASAAEAAGVSIRSDFAGMAAAIEPLIDGIKEAIQWMETLSSHQQAQGSKEFLLGSAQDFQRWTGGKGVIGRAATRFIDAHNAEQRSRERQLAYDKIAPMLGQYDVMGNPIAKPGHFAPPASKKKKGRKGSGASAADKAAREEERYQDELGHLRVDQLRAQSDYTSSLEDKYAAVLAALDEELASFVRQTETHKGLAPAKRALLIAEKTAAINAERRNAMLDKERDLAEERYKNETEANRLAQADADAALSIANTREEQYAIEQRILKLKQSQERAEYERLLKSRDVNEVIAGQAGLAKLDQRQATQTEDLHRKYGSPLEKYAQQLNASSIGDQVESLVVDELQSVRDGIHNAMHKALGIKDPLIAGLLDILLDEILFKPLAQKLAGAGGGGGGGLLGSIASVGLSLFGRASGGSVMGGHLYRVNEAAGAGRAEAFMPQGSGKIIPLGRMDALSGAGSGPKVFNITVDARNSVTPSGFAQELSTHILRQAQAMDAQTARAVVKAVPSRVQQYQRDGY